jgi:hypothetical protein
MKAIDSAYVVIGALWLLIGFTLSGGPEPPTIIGSLGLLLGAIIFFVVIWRARNAIAY